MPPESARFRLRPVLDQAGLRTALGRGPGDDSPGQAGFSADRPPSATVGVPDLKLVMRSRDKPQALQTPLDRGVQLDGYRLNRTRRHAEIETTWPTHAQSEEASHSEHHAALEATLFERPPQREELVLELDSGMLRLRVRQG